MISILFVDDEERLLEGIQNSLRRRLSEWDLGFACSGAEALDILTKRPYDIVVADMRMPGMDGAELLTVIQKKYPSMIRFILTGQAEKEAIIRAIPVTHQFIYKPCSPPELLELLDRACNLHSRVHSEEIMRLISASKGAPTAPTTAKKIAEIAASDNGSFRDIANVIERDPGLAARVIQLANSAAMGHGREVTRVFDAVSRIGLECAQALAVANDIFQPQPQNSFLKKVIKKTCDTSYAGAALVAKFLEGHPNSGPAMTAALLRDIGLLVTAGSNIPICNAVLEQGLPAEQLLDLELRKCGVTHADVGGHLLALWGIPLTIVEAVTYHHNIEESLIDPFIMASVHVADIVVSNPTASCDEIRSMLNWTYFSLHGIEDDVETWLELVEISQSAAA